VLNRVGQKKTSKRKKKSVKKQTQKKKKKGFWRLHNPGGNAKKNRSLTSEKTYLNGRKEL